jgi:hypothetical protein
VLLGCCLANRLGRHAQARRRRAQLVGGVGEQPLLMESKAGSKFLFYRVSYRKTASHFSGAL